MGTWETNLPCSYAADYRPSIPNQLERTPLTSAPPQRETTTLQNSAGGGHVVAIAPIDPALNGMYSPKQLQYDSESSGEAEVRTPPSSAPLWVGTESDSDHHSTEHDTDSSIEYDYPSSESWEPTPQHRRRPRALPDSPQDEPNTNAKRMKKSRRKTGGRADTPTVLHLRDREVTRKRITLSELNVKKRSKAPQDCHQKSPKVTNANKRGRARIREELMVLTPRRRVPSPVLRGSTTSESPLKTPQPMAPSPG